MTRGSRRRSPRSPSPTPIPPRSPPPRAAPPTEERGSAVVAFLLRWDVASAVVFGLSTIGYGAVTIDAFVSAETVLGLAGIYSLVTVWNLEIFRGAARRQHRGALVFILLAAAL